MWRSALCSAAARAGRRARAVATSAEAVAPAGAMKTERVPGDRAARAKDPPHLRAARDRICTSGRPVSGVYDFLSGVPDARQPGRTLGGARADDYAAGHLPYGPTSEAGSSLRRYSSSWSSVRGR